MNIFLTDNAKKHFSKVIQDNKSIQLGLKKSGCSGFSYVLNIVDKTLEENTYTFDGFKFIVDDKDKKSLDNLVIDYKKEGLSQKIVFNNPNVMNECGCGESFSLKGN